MASINFNCTTKEVTTEADLPIPQQPTQDVITVDLSDLEQLIIAGVQSGDIANPSTTAQNSVAKATATKAL